MMERYIASVSWGKDSTAMLIKLLETDAPLDEVVFFDTGMEFDAIYQTRDLLVKRYLEPRGIMYTELHPKRPFIDMMVNHPHLSKTGQMKAGYGWCGGLCRWGTTAKLQALAKKCKGSHQYIGIAADEVARLARLTPDKSAPLAEMGITEAEALKICYAHGIYFGGLYEILDRLSCWCCRNKNMKELANYKKYLPRYFEKLLELERLIGEPMKKPKSLEERFPE